MNQEMDLVSWRVPSDSPLPENTGGQVLRGVPMSNLADDSQSTNRSGETPPLLCRRTIRSTNPSIPECALVGVPREQPCPYLRLVSPGRLSSAVQDECVPFSQTPCARRSTAGTADQ